MGINSNPINRGYRVVFLGFLIIDDGPFLVSSPQALLQIADPSYRFLPFAHRILHVHTILIYVIASDMLSLGLVTLRICETSTRITR